MRATAWLIAACVALAPRALAQNLPDLGSAGDSVLSPQMERRLGESIVRDIRFREPAYIDDPEISEYLGNLVDLKGFEAAQRRLKLLLHLDRPERADGYRTYFCRLSRQEK